MRKLGLIAGSVLAGVSLVGPLQGVADAQAGKLVVIVMENETYANIVGNSQAPYLNQLIASGELFTNYAGVASGSNPNYLAMTSGLTSAQSPPALNIFQAIDGSGGALSWKEFMESMPGNCAQGNYADVPGTSVTLYTADHDPDYQYRAATTCSANDIPMTASTFSPASLPSLSYVVPNECDDMHTLPTNGQACPAYFGSNPGSSLISMGDNWLATVVPPLLAQPNVTVLITWDEGSLNTTPPEHLVALEAGAGVTAGSTDGTAYTHFGLEAGLYRYFGLGTAPGNGATATPLPFPSPAPPAAPTVSSVTPISGWTGSAVTVIGSGFTGATAVTFNGTAATFTVTSDTQMTATVPSGATTGPIAVTAPAGTGTSSASFTVTAQPAPTISAFSPSSATVGSSITISGSGFTEATAVTFNGTAATFTVVSDSGITAKVPTGATTGPIAVTAPAGTGTSSGSFTVTSSSSTSYYGLVTADPTLLAYWRLGETSGTVAADTTGTYNGAYVNKPTLGSRGAIANDPATSVTFNGTSQRITLPSLPSVGDFSIEGWTYLTNSSVNNNTLYGNVGTVRLLARPGTGSYRTAAYAGVTLNGTEYVLQPISPASNINTWVYWVVTRQGGTMTLYRDGVQIAQRTDLPATATATITGYIADQANGNYYLNGRIDDVAIYASALSASTVASHYQAALHGPPPS
jgi:Concanavalin A-like lectin/glucanases superfamily/Phosphoesterase family